MKDNMLTVSVAGEGYQAHLVIDSIVAETSSGGVRIGESVPLVEVATLAREMTLKYASFQLPRGGAKLGVSMPGAVSRERKLRMLRELGTKLGPLIRTGVYYPGMDMNCGADDLREIYRGAGITVGELTDSSFFTALGVESALEAYYDESPSQGPLSIAIEGFGRVAGHLAARLNPARFKIVAISTLAGAIQNDAGFELKSLTAAREQHGDDLVNQLTGVVIEPEQLFGAAADILVPSSRTWMIHENNVDEIKASVIVPVANAPYAEGTSERLHARGVLCLPGHITNAGGVFGSTLHDSGLSSPEVELLVEQHVRPMMRQLISLSRQLDVSPIDFAKEAIVEELAARGKKKKGSSKLAQMRRRFRRFVPRAARKSFVRQRFVDSLARLTQAMQRVADEHSTRVDQGLAGHASTDRRRHTADKATAAPLAP